MNKDFRNWMILLAVLGSLPFWALNTVYYQGIFIRAFVYVALAQSWNIISGLGGQISLGNTCFQGVGAYTCGLLFENLGLSPWIGGLIGIGVAVLLSFMIGYPCFRLSGIYFTLSTFTVSLILEVLARHFDKLTGGDVGLNIRLMGDAPRYFQFSSPIYYYFIALAIISLNFWITQRVLHSGFGYYLKAIRDDQGAAESMGVDSAQVKLKAFAISASMASVAGIFYTQYNLFIDPTVFGMGQNLQIVLAAIAGGIGSLWGPVVGGLFIIPVSEISNALFGKAGVDVLIYGTILMVIILYIPKGLISLPSLFRKR
jgi:branched-chain amino acid transport system permease protein